MRAAAVFLALALMTGACGDSGDDADDSAADSSATTDTTAPRELTKLTMVTVPYFALEQVAKSEGFFEDHGLDVSLVAQTAQGSAGVQAVVAGHADTAQGVTYSAILQAREGGAKLKSVVSGYLATSKRPNNKFFVKKDSGINSAADLKGKRVGMANQGTATDFYLQSYLKKAGIPVDQVQRIAVPPPDGQNALLTGNVEVVGTYDVFYAKMEAEASDQVKVLFTDRDTTIPGEGTSGYFFTEDFIAAKPQVVKDFIAAMKDAADFVKENPEKAKDIIAAATKLTLDNVIVPEYPENLCLSEEAAGKWGEELTSLGVIKGGKALGLSGVTNELNEDC
jgi:NitT/TauT family transport system substrate-binding protein